MNPDNPYAAPQTIDTREVLPSLPPTDENRDYRWLKRGLGSLALVLSPLTMALIWQFQEFAVLGLSVIVPFCSGMLAAVPRRTPGKSNLTLAAIAQAIGCFCLFVLVLLPTHDQDQYKNRFKMLTLIVGVTEIVFQLSLSIALLRIGYWLQDRWFCLLNYCTLALSGLLVLSMFLIVNFTSGWDRLGFMLTALAIFGGLGYLVLWITLISGLRIPRLISARIADPPRFE